MIDWVAVGAVAAVAAAVVGYLQFRHSRETVPRAGQRLVASIEDAKPPPPPVPPPELTYQILEGSGAYKFPEEWMAPVGDVLWLVHRGMESELSEINFAILVVKNKNDFVINSIDLELRVSRAWSCKIEFTTNLAKSAIKVKLDSNHLFLRVAEMPASECIVISVLCAGMVGSSVASANASVTLKRIWIGDV